MLALLAQNTLNIFRALRMLILRKTTLLRLLVRRYENQKLFLLFFLSPSPGRRAQRAEIFVFPWDFPAETVSERK